MLPEPISDISKLAQIGEGTKIWGFSKVCDGVRIGDNSVVGRGVYMGPGVIVGHRCKIQNHALIYEPAVLGNGVFIGPGAILTNDLNPRAVNVNFELKSEKDWDKQGVIINEGASIGAGAVCVAPASIGKWAMVGAGSVVLKDVPDFALVVGAPAVQIGWVGRAGYRLKEVGTEKFLCEKTSEEYALIQGSMRLVEQ